EISMMCADDGLPEGAFTPGCSVNHLPGFINKLADIKAQGVDLVCVVAFNDAFVMNAWAKANGIKEEIKFMSDADAKFSKSIGWTKGERTGRYAMIIDHGKITYAENEPGGEVTLANVWMSQPRASSSLLKASANLEIKLIVTAYSAHLLRLEDMFRFHKSLDVITLFHKASSAPSIRAHTLLKQISAQASETATEDQAADHTAQNKIQRSEFELNVTEDPPTGDQLRTILEYVGSGGGRAGQIVEGAADEADALKKLKEDPSRFKPPVIVDWNNGRAGE
ncbi:MAG: hypothetical protein Q9174_003483, partial [Haloplaca sp. 1 TL-2023]